MSKGKAGNQSVKALEDINFWPTNDPHVVALELVDEKKRALAAALEFNTLTSVIGKALDVAVNAVFATASMARQPERPQCHIDGTRVEFRSGRSPKEIAMTTTIGCVQMVVFLPLAEVLRATRHLIESIEEDHSPGPH